MEQYWLGFYSGFLCTMAIWNIITIIHNKRKTKEIEKLLDRTQQINDALIKKQQSESYDHFAQWDR